MRGQRDQPGAWKGAGIDAHSLTCRYHDCSRSASDRWLRPAANWLAMRLARMAIFSTSSAGAQFFKDVLAYLDLLAAAAAQMPILAPPDERREIQVLPGADAVFGHEHPQLLCEVLAFRHQSDAIRIC